MWITRQRPAARPRPPVGFEALEVRFLLATIGPASLEVGMLDSGSERPIPAISRIDNYDLPATLGHSELKIQIQWNAGDPAQGTLIILPTSDVVGTQRAISAPEGFEGLVLIQNTTGDLSGWGLLYVKVEVDPAPADDSTESAGTYDLSIGWTIPAPSPQFPAGTGVGAAAPAPTTGPDAGDSSRIAVKGKPLPPADAPALPPWLVQSTPEKHAPAGSLASAPVPSAQLPATAAPSVITQSPVVVPSAPTTPLSSSGGSTSSLGPTGPFLPPVASPVGPIVGGAPFPAARGEGRSAGPESFGAGSGPSLIVGPLPLGRSEPDGGIFARSFTSTVGRTGPTGAESLVAVGSPSGVAQSLTDAAPWSGSLGLSSSEDWLTPFGIDPGMSARPTPAPPSPLAASASEDARSEEAVLLPSVAAATPEPIPLERVRAVVPPALAFAVPAASPTERPAVPALPPSPRGPRGESDADRPRSQGWSWPAVTLTALTATAVMIFRCHGWHEAVEDRA